MRVRKIHIDYEGDSDSPKPMMLFLEPRAEDAAKLEQRAREAFVQFFPEWQLRRCVVEGTEEDMAEEELTPLPGTPGVWVTTRENPVVPGRASAP